MTGLSLALANLKPGTGKTTSAVWLAHVFAQAGNSLLLVDADPSGSALEWSDLAAMCPRLAPAQAVFPFRIVALPSRELHRRLPEIARNYDVVIIDTPQIEDHAAIARSALRYADEIVIPCAPSPIEINRTSPVRQEIAEVRASGGKPGRSAVLLNRCIARAHSTSILRSTSYIRFCTLLQFLEWTAIPLPRVTYPTMPSPRIGLQHLARYTRRSSTPFTLITRSPGSPEGPPGAPPGVAYPDGAGAGLCESGAGSCTASGARFWSTCRAENFP